MQSFPGTTSLTVIPICCDLFVCFVFNLYLLMFSIYCFHMQSIYDYFLLLDFCFFNKYIYINDNSVFGIPMGREGPRGREDVGEEKKLLFQIYYI